MSAIEVCGIAKECLTKRFPDTNIETAPLTDGGEGFVEILTNHVGGSIYKHAVQRPHFGGSDEHHAAMWGMVNGHNLGEHTKKILDLPRHCKQLAIVEMAQASGLETLPPEKRNPWHTTSYGTGELIQEAVDQGADSVLMGIGGSATNDLGVGALQALGMQFYDSNGHHIQYPLSPVKWEQVDTMVPSEQLEPLPVRIACDVSNPLLGTNGSTSIYGPQKGLPLHEVSPMESAIHRMARKMCDSSGAGLETLETPGAGAAGGIGCGFLISGGASLIPGFELIESWLQLRTKITNADWILTGEGCVDESSLSGKGPVSILKRADNHTRKTLIAGQVTLTSDQISMLGIDDLVLLVNENKTLSENLKAAPVELAEKLETLY